MIAIVVHEVSHGYVAYLMGDKTAKNDGRLSLNPLHHIDWIGAICLVIFHIGWAKPVPINPYMFKNRKTGTMLVSLAGVFSNFILAIISAFALCFVVIFDGNIYLYQFFIMLLTVNIGLGVFNLIPIPPLDGSKFLAEFLPLKAKIKYLQFERFGGILLFVLIYFGNLSSYISIAVNYVSNFFLNTIAGVIL